MSKKSKKYTISIIVLTVLLAISLIVGSTFAWFYSIDNAQVSLKFGDAVILNIVKDRNGGDTETLPISIPGSYLVPGMNINLYAGAMFSISDTPAVLRVSFNIDITGGTASDEQKIELKYLLLDSLEALVNGTGDGNWVYIPSGSVLRDGQTPTKGDWWYYLGGNPIVKPQGSQNKAMANAQSVLASIDCTNATPALRTVTFADGNLLFPKSVDNAYAGVSIKFSVVFQSLQAYFPAYSTPGWEGENQGTTGYRINKIANVYELFEATFK